MVRLTDSLENTLAARLLGSGEFNTGIDSLDTALTLQFRVHYHLFGAGTTAVIGQVLLDDCEKLEKSLRASGIDSHTSGLIKNIIYNVKGVLCFHMGQIEESVRLLGMASGISIQYEKYKKYLDLESLYYRGLCKRSTSIYFQELFKIIDKIPKESEGLTLHYLHLILGEIAKKHKAKDILEHFPKKNSLTLLAVSFTQECDEKTFFDFTPEVLQNSKFPRADETNNVDLEQFHAFLPHFFKNQKSISSEWYSFIVASMGKTFQSVDVAKSAMIYFARSSNPSKFNGREAVLNFVNFARYSEKQFEVNGSYDDIISLIECYAFALELVDDASWNIENVFNLEETTGKLESLLTFFYSEYKFPLMENGDSLNWLENSSKLFLPRTVSDVLAKAWGTLYLKRAESLEHLLSNDLACYLSNAMCVASKVDNLVDLQFQYSYVLAVQRHIEPAIKILKTVLLEANPDCYKAWHLLALCESIREDKETSFKIVCSVLEAMKESFNEKKLKLVERWQFVQLKLTQLGLIEEIFGTLDATEMLPEVFELFSSLFPEDTKEFDRIGKECNQTKEYLMQLIWVFSANMYMRLGDRVDDSKNAIKEAKRVTDAFKNLNCDIATGFLNALTGDKKEALKKFESVLFYDPMNVNAMIGFAEIVFPEELTGSESTLSNYYQLNGSFTGSQTAEKDNRVFANDVDKSVACARLKFMLEYAITKSIEAYHSPEVWWYLSLVYEKYEDKTYKESLLNCIRYKESNPIRGFRFCNY